ncbi:SH3 domain-containing protein [Roseovarius sp. SCSIO 43702]|uniref:SH3 domain-containing protein n=1 Tax=Roseovarius sp. SCSIO 43702 TaxID=2823043 RepID=UPI001C7341D7|nr:SH3 domain-containing protein [Roseovarius sp. SCSIO 43702]QYX56748.1 SH3 domain-containing protein [Roseovarius sp. SCSIO 43702]
MRFRDCFIALALAPVAFSAAAAERADYRCTAMGDGAYRVTLAGDEPDRAVAVYVLNVGGARSGEIVLERAVAGSGFLYRGEGLEFRGEGEVATLSDGELEATCVIYEAGEDEADGAADEPGEVSGPAMALGGNVRTGPGTQHDKIGRLTRGTEITLVERTDAMLDGHPWFRVTLPNGRDGFVWGGILCAPEGGVAGLAETCD